MRTTIDLPDELYRALRTRAALEGTTMRRLVRELLESGLGSGGRDGRSERSDRRPPPVIVAPRGVPIAARTPEELRDLEASDERAKLGGPA